MNSRDALESKRELLLSIPEESVQRPRAFAVNHYLQVSEKLYSCTLKDQANLVSRGMNWSVVMDIPVRVRTLMEAETLWQLKRKTATDTATGKWKQAYNDGYSLFNRLINEFRFAFSRDSRLLNYVREISKRKRKADMIMNLNELSELGLSNTGLLRVTLFDMTLLTTAKETAAELTALWAKAMNERLKGHKEKNLRDRAYTHLKEAIAYVAQYGKFVFYRDGVHRAVYNISAYLTAHPKNEIKPVPEPEGTSPIQTPKAELPVPILREMNSENFKNHLNWSANPSPKALTKIDSLLSVGPP